MKPIYWILLTSIVPSAEATTILPSSRVLAQVDFELRQPKFAYSCHYAIQGNPFQDNSDQIGETMGGVGHSSSGLSTSVDFPMLPNEGADYSGSGFGLGVHLDNRSPLPSSDLTNYRFSLEANILGQQPGLTTVSRNLELSFCGPSYLLSLTFPMDFKTDGWVTITIGIEKSHFNEEDAADFAAHFYAVNAFDVRATLDGRPRFVGNEPNYFGFDEDNFTAIENIVIFTIPEPSGILMLLPLTVFFWHRRRE